MTSSAHFEEYESLKLARPFLDRTVDLVIDRPYGSHHPTYGFVYLANYGYVPGTLAPAGDELDAYYMGGRHRHRGTIWSDATAALHSQV